MKSFILFITALFSGWFGADTTVISTSTPTTTEIAIVIPVSTTTHTKKVVKQEIKTPEVITVEPMKLYTSNFEVVEPIGIVNEVQSVPVYIPTIEQKIESKSNIVLKNCPIDVPSYGRVSKYKGTFIVRDNNKNFVETSICFVVLDDNGNITDNIKSKVFSNGIEYKVYGSYIPIYDDNDILIGKSLYYNHATLPFNKEGKYNVRIETEKGLSIDNDLNVVEI